MIDPKHIRNFCIIAHIDHGKSTLADRFIQLCGGLTEREMADQVLDSMDIERERGITIKAQSVTLMYEADDGETYQLNIIDTPGHVDFTYEVSRSMAACEGALLVVDAAQGVEAQSVANCYTAVEQGLEVMPVLNKIDLPQAEPDRVCQEIEEIIGIDATGAVQVSAKNGIGIRELLEEIVATIPPPEDKREDEPQALIIDSWFDNYLGVVSLVRVMQGAIKVKDRIVARSIGKMQQVDLLLEVAESIPSQNIGVSIFADADNNGTRDIGGFFQRLPFDDRTAEASFLLDPGIYFTHVINAGPDNVNYNLSLSAT